MRWLHPQTQIECASPRLLARSWQTISAFTLALAIAAGQAFFLASFWAPAPGRPGIDENAYLVAGKNIATTGSPAQQASDDFQYIDTMWVGTETRSFAPPLPLPGPVKWLVTARTQSGWFYPKYPIGLPILNALAMRLHGAGSDFAARRAAFAVSPVCMVLASLGMCLLTFMLCGSIFHALLAMIVLFTAPAVLQLSEVPNSHAPSLCAVVWGMVLLIRFQRRGSAWFGAGAGLLLGVAVTFRYSEALLLLPLYPLDQILTDTNLQSLHPILWKLILISRVLPIGPLGIASLLTIGWRQPRSYLRAIVPLATWAIPVGALLSFNWFSMGHLTGYDSTHESSGFTTAEFLRKWDFAVQHLYVYGLFLIAPLGIAGLGLMFRRQWRDALILAMWFLPGALLYTAYYWGTQSPGVGFLRFLVTLFPPLIVGAMWLLKAASSDGGGVAESLTAGFLVAVASCIGLIGSLHVMNVQHLGNINLAVSAENASRAIGATKVPPSKRIIFADEGLFPQFLQYGQFMIDGTWYASDAFQPQIYGGFGFLGMLQNDKSANDPALVQPERIKHMMAVEAGQTPAMLAARELKLINEAIAGGKSVFAILTANQRDRMAAVLAPGRLRLTQLMHWTEPYNVPLDIPDDPTPADPGDGTFADNLLAPPFDPGKGLFPWAPQSRAAYLVQQIER